MKFQEKIQQAIENTILKNIQDTRLLDYHSHKKQVIPQDLIDKAWSNINWDDVLETVSVELQKRVANAVISNMATEINTDVKKLMSLPGLREELRIKVYPEFKECIKKFKGI